MWPRVVEMMLGCWLLASPFIFGHTAEQTGRWIVDLGGGLAIIGLSLSCYWRPMRRAHLGILLVAAGLMAFGYFAEPHPPPPALQNDLVLGLLVSMFAIIPSECHLPPMKWREQRP